MPARQADGHHRHVGDGGMKRGQVRNRAVKMRTVVAARCEHGLRVDFDVHLGQPRQVFHDLPGAGIVHQPDAHIRLGRVNGDVEWAEVLFRDARPIAFIQVGEGDVIAVEERETVVVVLDVERPAQPRRHLADEAKVAVVAARANFAVEQLGFEGETQSLPVTAIGIQRLLPARPFDQEFQLWLGGVELHVDHVAQRHPIERQ